MPNRKDNTWLTTAEKEEIRQIIREQGMFGWTNKQALEICKTRLPKRPNLSLRTYANIRAQEVDKNDVTQKMTILSTVGFQANFLECMDNMFHIRHVILEELEYERSKPDGKRNPYVIDKLTRNAREQELAISQMSVSSPVLMQMKNTLDKRANEFLKYKELTEDSGKDRNTETRESDEFAA